MAQKAGIRETFVVQILNNQNATWQGTVMWVDKKTTQPFRSALELIRLIDSAVEDAASDGTSVSPGEIPTRTFEQEHIHAV